MSSAVQPHYGSRIGDKFRRLRWKRRGQLGAAFDAIDGAGGLHGIRIMCRDIRPIGAVSPLLRCMSLTDDGPRLADEVADVLPTRYHLTSPSSSSCVARDFVTSEVMEAGFYPVECNAEQILGGYGRPSGSKITRRHCRRPRSTFNLDACPKPSGKYPRVGPTRFTKSFAPNLTAGPIFSTRVCGTNAPSCSIDCNGNIFSTELQAVGPDDATDKSSSLESPRPVGENEGQAIAGRDPARATGWLPTARGETPSRERAEERREERNHPPSDAAGHILHHVGAILRRRALAGGAAVPQLHPDSETSVAGHKERRIHAYASPLFLHSPLFPPRRRLSQYVEPKPAKVFDQCPKKGAGCGAGQRRGWMVEETIKPSAKAPDRPLTTGCYLHRYMSFERKRCASPPLKTLRVYGALRGHASAVLGFAEKQPGRAQKSKSGTWAPRVNKRRIPSAPVSRSSRSDISPSQVTHMMVYNPELCEPHELENGSPSQQRWDSPATQSTRGRQDTREKQDISQGQGPTDRGSRRLDNVASSRVPVNRGQRPPSRRQTSACRVSSCVFVPYNLARPVTSARTGVFSFS